MRRFLSIFLMDMRNLFKNLVLLGYNTVFVLLLVWIIGSLCSGDYANSRSGYQYTVLSFMVYVMLSGAMTASNCFMERDIKRPNLRIIYSPVGSFPIYFSKILASFLFDYLLHSLVLIFMCLIFHVSLGKQPMIIFLLMAPIEFFSASLGIFFCCILHSEEATSSILSTVISLLCILGGCFFPLDGLGKVMAFVTYFSPVKWINDVFFAVSCDNNYVLFCPVFLAGCVGALLLIIGCRLFFRTEDYL